MDAQEIRALLGKSIFERAQKYRKRILQKQLHHQRGRGAAPDSAGAGQRAGLLLYAGLAAGKRQLCQRLLRLPL